MLIQTLFRKRTREGDNRRHVHQESSPPRKRRLQSAIVPIAKEENGVEEVNGHSTGRATSHCLSQKVTSEMEVPQDMSKISSLLQGQKLLSVVIKKEEAPKIALATDSDVRKRNMRMFGFLRGTLNTFQKEAVSDKSSEVRNYSKLQLRLYFSHVCEERCLPVFAKSYPPK